MFLRLVTLGSGTQKMVLQMLWLTAYLTGFPPAGLRTLSWAHYLTPTLSLHLLYILCSFPEVFLCYLIQLALNHIEISIKIQRTLVTGTITLFRQTPSFVDIIIWLINPAFFKHTNDISLY